MCWCPPSCTHVVPFLFSSPLPLKPPQSTTGYIQSLHIGGLQKQWPPGLLTITHKPQINHQLANNNTSQRRSADSHQSHKAWTGSRNVGREEADAKPSVTRGLLFVLTVQTATEIDGAGHVRHTVVKSADAQAGIRERDKVLQHYKRWGKQKREREGPADKEDIKKQLRRTKYLKARRWKYY